MSTQRPMLVLTVEHHSSGMEGVPQGRADLRLGKRQFCSSVYLKYQFLLLEGEEKESEMFINLVRSHHAVMAFKTRDRHYSTVRRQNIESNPKLI